MNLPGDPIPDETPLTNDELIGLIPTWVATRADLNLAEQVNIENAVRWAFIGRRPVTKVADLLSITFSNRLHRRMFGDVWAWAGQYRTRQTNLGVDPSQIAEQMKLALDDTVFWHADGVFEPAEIAVRLHHRLVSVHPYPNGNGRHTRMLADYYLHATRHPRLSWGAHGDLGSPNANRHRYIDALRSADAGDYDDLIAFATS